jgi:hypothetical protein
MGSDFLPHAENRTMQNMHITNARKSLTQSIATQLFRTVKNLIIP